jgi:hypothetical protein
LKSNISQTARTTNTLVKKYLYSTSSISDRAKLIPAPQSARKPERKPFQNLSLNVKEKVPSTSREIQNRLIRQRNSTIIQTKSSNIASEIKSPRASVFIQKAQANLPTLKSVTSSSTESLTPPIPPLNLSSLKKHAKGTTSQNKEISTQPVSSSTQTISHISIKFTYSHQTSINIPPASYFEDPNTLQSQGHSISFSSEAQDEPDSRMTGFSIENLHNHYDHDKMVDENDNDGSSIVPVVYIPKGFKLQYDPYTFAPL